MKEASKLKQEEEVYSPSSKPVSRARIFQSLCDDPDYPCRDCTLVPNTMTCVNNSCAAWAIWYKRIWRRLRKRYKTK